MSHDRYFLERVCDVTYALLGDGRCVLLPGGVEEYLARRRTDRADRAAGLTAAAGRSAGSSAPPGVSRQARKDLSRIEAQLSRLETEIGRLHDQMAAAGHDHVQLQELHAAVETATARQAELEDSWLAAAEHV